MKENNDSLWIRIVDGLKEKPAYLLVFSIVALFFLGGLLSWGTGLVKDNNIAIIAGAVVDIIALAAACYVIRVVEEPAYKTYYKAATKRKRVPSVRIEPSKIEERAKDILNNLLVQGDLSLGLLYKDPTSKLVMTHTAVGDYAERERMSDILASFITAKKSSTGLVFNKVVVPKSGNTLLGFRVAEKLGAEIVAFRGEAYPIAQDKHLELKKNYFDGRLEEDDVVIIVDDVTFRGDTIKKTLEWLKTANVKIKAVFVLAAHAQHIEDLKSIIATNYPGTSFYPVITI